MNTHSTPRPFAMRSIAGGSSQQPQQRQPPAPQVSTNEEYGAIPDEDRDHIDEVAHAAHTPDRQFDLMDMKKKGWLNSYEFKHSLAALGFDLPKPEYFRELETYGSVPPDWQDPHSCPVNRLYIYLDQFRLCAAKLIANRDPREEAAKVFSMFDYDQDGIISFDDMRHLAQDIKDERAMTDEEIQSMIEHLDHDGKGGVNLEEFIQMMEEAG
ncbi:Cell division control protein 31 [Tolypocladium paradoxum]|uniref:Cell division control protein 31 n=1 Tax=Tolypocladium paradoxum TaxID=94208 RepID=A0A2S4LAA4_9HYPO|nr:Cell division control protein 31 [Tolypocladium paradoxum]